MATLSDGFAEHSGVTSWTIPTTRKHRPKSSGSKARIDELERELAQVRRDRDRYLSALYDVARQKREFADLTLEDMKRMSAGPVFRFRDQPGG